MAGFASLAKPAAAGVSWGVDGPLYMDEVITPHRSLSERGFIILIAVMTAINCATAVVFVSLGAAPVPVFLGLDLVAVVIALAISNRRALRKERVQVSAAMSGGKPSSAGAFGFAPLSSSVRMNANGL